MKGRIHTHMYVRVYGNGFWGLLRYGDMCYIPYRLLELISHVSHYLVNLKRAVDCRLLV